jgi:hypothetical protein
MPRRSLRFSATRWSKTPSFAGNGFPLPLWLRLALILGHVHAHQRIVVRIARQLKRAERNRRVTLTHAEPRTTAATLPSLSISTSLMVSLAAVDYASL